jgi:hypothetical protein
MKSFKRFISENTNHYSARHYFAESSLHGVGSFASEDIPENDLVFLFLKRNHMTETPSFDRTDFCRLTNHSYDPNLHLEIIGEDIFAVSLRQISEDEELTIDYEDALDLVAIRQNAAINEKVLKITPGFENLNIEDDTDKNLIDEIKILRKVK